LARGALIIVEEKTGAADILPEGIKHLETRNYGETSLTFAEGP
jgi:16S rRNA G966 N2-methylase RsmD